MKAVVFHQHGGPEVLKVEEVPTPQVGDRDALVRVKATSLNHLDLWLRRGLRAINPPLPHVGGSDCAGVVEKVGSQVTNVKVGDRVVVYAVISCGHCEFCDASEESVCKDFGILGEHMWGGLAEFIKVPARNLLALPPDIPFEEAAAAALSMQTAWRMLITKAQIRPGEDVLVVGAGGGVSTSAIQIAKLVGCRVFATTGGPGKVERAKKVGADFVVDYKANPDWEKEIYLATGKRGMDVVVDSVGQATWQKSLRSLRKGGRLVTCGATTGPEGITDIRSVFWRQISIHGSTMASRKEFDDVMKLVFRRQLKPIIHTKLPWTEAAKGHEMMEHAEQFGKIVLTMP